MHVAAADPRFLRREEVTAEVLEKEKEIARDRARNEGKPEKILDKIIEGRMAKFYEEVCLLEQPFIKDDTKKVADVVKEAAAGRPFEVVRFARFALGA
jgi:elongation factor Ts